MKKIFKTLLLTVSLLIVSGAIVQAAPQNYIVQKGDSMWKIAVKYEIGLSEIISTNPQIKDPNLIYPNQKISIPDISNITSIEKKVVTLVNIERKKQGLSPLKENWELSRVARYKSRDMMNKKYFSHTSPTYGSPFNMMKTFGISYTAAGENIAKGQPTPESVMDSWMNSSGHRANILSNSFTHIGVGLETDSNGTKYWTQMFIRP